MRIHSVENRFIAIILGALILFVIPLFVLFLTMSSERNAQETLERGQIMLNANAKALGKPLWDLDNETVRQITRAIISVNSVLKVRVRDASGSIEVEIPERPLPRSIDVANLRSDIFYETFSGIHKVGFIEMSIEQQRFLTGGDWREIVFVGLFAVSVLVMFATAVVGNRIMVIKPLLRLTAAIEATRQLGSRHHVDWKSSDEMGQLATNFNEMQERLAEEETAIRLAHNAVSRIYNRTPAMLFSVDEDDRIRRVSDYWVETTGYDRDTSLNRRFEDFLDPACREIYRNRSHASGEAITVKFRRPDRSAIDVIIRETHFEQEGLRLSLLVMTDVTDLKAAEERNMIQAITDHLTGLPNRQGFETALGAMIANADEVGSEVACLFVDLDRFKWINDNLGHAAGDAVLCNVVERIRKNIRPGDLVARLGGDEFAILIGANAVSGVAADVAARVNEALRLPFPLDGRRVTISASIGVAVYPHDAENAGDLLQKSDIAMYARKRDGKNGTQIFDQDLEQSFRQLAKTERDIEDGLREDWFEAWLQPIVDIRTGATIGFEALMRLNHPEDGILPPADIIKVAEDNGMIVEIGTRIFERAVESFAQLAAYPEYARCYLAVNFSPLQFEATMVAQLLTTLTRNGVSPDQIAIEVTEAVLMHDDPLIAELFVGMRKAGFRIALDDFGTGYSSLAYLHRFPVDLVKVDQSFTRALTASNGETRKRTQMLVEGIRTISHQLNCKVIAEGIETEEQQQILRDLGIEFGQGYFYCRPLPPEKLLEKIESVGRQRHAV